MGACNGETETATRIDFTVEPFSLRSPLVISHVWPELSQPRLGLQAGQRFVTGAVL